VRERGIRKERVASARRSITSVGFQVDSRLLAEKILLITGAALLRPSRVPVRQLSGISADSPRYAALRWLLSGVEKREPH
jgi:hypothetical protein